MTEILVGHSSFYLRSGWIKKGVEYIKKNSAEDAFSKKKIEAVDILGIGSVMIQSLKFWMVLLDILEKKDKKYILKRHIELIIEKDPYFQNKNTLWLLHIYIMERDNKNEIPVLWRIFIKNKKNLVFTEKIAEKKIELYFSEKNITVSSRSIKDSLSVFIKNYYKEVNLKIDSEDNMFSPFTGLKYLKKNLNGEFYFRNIEANEISEYLALYLMMRELNEKNRNEITLNKLYENFNSIIKIRKEEYEKLINRLENKEIISQDRSAGLQNIHIKNKISEEQIIKKIIESES